MADSNPDAMDCPKTEVSKALVLTVTMRDLWKRRMTVEKGNNVQRLGSVHIKGKCVEEENMLK